VRMNCAPSCRGGSSRPLLPRPAVRGSRHGHPQGLKLHEAEYSCARPRGGLPDAPAFLRLLMREKTARVRQEGVLEASHGLLRGRHRGLENLKDWLQVRERFIQIYLKASPRSSPRPSPDGIAGCGKSSRSRPSPTSGNSPLRLDMNLVFSESYGPAEQCSTRPSGSWRAWPRPSCGSTRSKWASPPRPTPRGGPHLRQVPHLDAGAQGVRLRAHRQPHRPPPAEMIRRGRFDQVFFVTSPPPRSARPSSRSTSSGARRPAQLTSSCCRSPPRITRAPRSSRSSSPPSPGHVRRAGTHPGRSILGDQPPHPAGHHMQEQIKAIRSWPQARHLGVQGARGDGYRVRSSA